MPPPFLTEYYEDLLTKKIEKYSKEKFFFYINSKTSFGSEYKSFRSNKTCNNDPYHYMCFNFFDEFFLYLENDIIENPYEENISYDTKHKFNYYLLIKENFYKTFKKMNMNVLCDSAYYNNYWNRSYEFKIFPDITKFIEGKYSKKTVYHNGIKYIRLKLKALCNMFIPKACITYDFIDKTLPREIVNPDNILFMAKPVKEKRSNIITLLYRSTNIKYKKEFRLSDTLILKYNDPTYQNIKQNRIENILEKYKEQKYYEECSDDDEIYGEVFNEETGHSFYIECIEYKNK